MGTARAVGLVSILSFISKLTGFMREMAIARGFGAGLETDAYKVAQSVPGIFFTVVGTALATVLVPTITEAFQKSKDEGFEFVNRLATIVVVVAGAIIVLVEVAFVPAIVHLLAPGFSADALSLSISLSRVLMPGLLFTTLASVATGLSHSMSEFVGPCVKHMPANILTVIAALWFVPTLGIRGLAWATLAGLGLEVVVQVPFLTRRGYKCAWRLELHDPTIRRVMFLMVPVILGGALTQTNTLVTRIFASLLPTGSISILDYSSRLVGMVSGIVITAVTTVLLPRFSQLAAEGRQRELGGTFVQGVSNLSALVVPMIGGLMVLRTPITRFVYQRGAFTAQDTVLTASVLLWAALGLFGTGIRGIASRAFYALKDTKTPMVNGILGVVLNVGLLLFFIRYMDLGIVGMALAPVCSGLCAGVILVAQLSRRLGGLDTGRLVSSMWRTVAATVAMAGAVWWTYPLIERAVPGAGFLSQAACLGSTIVIGGSVYMVCLTLLGSKEAKHGWATVRRKGSKYLPG